MRNIYLAASSVATVTRRLLLQRPVCLVHLPASTDLLHRELTPRVVASASGLGRKSVWSAVRLSGSEQISAVRGPCKRTGLSDRFLALTARGQSQSDSGVRASGLYRKGRVASEKGFSFLLLELESRRFLCIRRLCCISATR